MLLCALPLVVKPGRALAGVRRRQFSTATHRRDVGQMALVLKVDGGPGKMQRRSSRMEDAAQSFRYCFSPIFTVTSQFTSTFCLFKDT